MIVLHQVTKHQSQMTKNQGKLGIWYIMVLAHFVDLETAKGPFWSSNKAASCYYLKLVQPLKDRNMPLSVLPKCTFLYTIPLMLNV